MTKEKFLFHYSCEWDTDEFLGWDEVWICIEQTILAENKRLKKEVGDLRAAAVRKILMKGGCFTGKGG